MSEGNRKRESRLLAEPVDAATLDALRAELMKATAGSRLPGPLRALLVEELVLRVDASTRLLGRMARSGALTRRGQVKASLRAYEEHQVRVETVARLLKLVLPSGSKETGEGDPDRSNEHPVDRARRELGLPPLPIATSHSVPPVPLMPAGSEIEEPGKAPGFFDQTPPVDKPEPVNGGSDVR